MGIRYIQRLEKISLTGRKLQVWGIKDDIVGSFDVNAKSLHNHELSIVTLCVVVCLQNEMSTGASSILDSRDYLE